MIILTPPGYCVKRRNFSFAKQMMLKKPKAYSRKCEENTDLVEEDAC